MGDGGWGMGDRGWGIEGKQSITGFLKLDRQLITGLKTDLVLFASFLVKLICQFFGQTSLKPDSMPTSDRYRPTDADRINC